MTEEKRDPQRTKRDYDEFVEHTNQRLRKFFTGALIAFAVIGICTAASLVGFTFALREIKDVRSDFIQASCEASNKANVETKKELAKMFRGGSVQQRESTEALIDRLAPVEDCEYLVKLSNGDATRTPVPTLSPTTTP